MWDIEMVVSVAAADEDEWTREDMERWGSQVPAAIFSLDFWVVERKHTFLVFYCYTVKQYRGNWHKLVLLAVYQNHLLVENNEKLADVKSVLKLLAGFVQTDISTASAKWRSLLWIVSNFHMSRVTRLNSHKFWPRCHVTLYEKAVTCRPTLPNSSL